MSDSMGPRASRLCLLLILAYVASNNLTMGFKINRGSQKSTKYTSRSLVRGISSFTSPNLPLNPLRSSVQDNPLAINPDASTTKSSDASRAGAIELDPSKFGMPDEEQVGGGENEEDRNDNDERSPARRRTTTNEETRYSCVAAIDRSSARGIQ